MPRGCPISRAKKAEIVSLSEAGMSGKQIASQLNLGTSSVYRILGKGTSAFTPVRVIDDPTGLFSSQAEFSMLDLACGIYLSTWPEGIEFEIDNHHRACFQSGLLVRDDGKQLETWSGGYKWT